MAWLIHIFNFVAQIAVALAMSRAFGPWAGGALYALLMCITTVIAGQLLRHSQIGRVTWRNRMAGLLLPWSMIVGGGSLTALCAKNAIASIVFGWTVIVCDQMNLFGFAVIPNSQSVSLAERWFALSLSAATVLGWLLAAGGWLMILKSYLSHRTEPITSLITHRNKRLPLFLPPVAIGASMLLRYKGVHGLAFWVVWIPLLVITLPVILMLLVILSYWIRGKPIRWN